MKTSGQTHTFSLSRMSRSLRYGLLAVTLSLSPLGIMQHASAAEYLLGPQDKVRLKIYEWRASMDTIFEWTALNDQFTVGANGKLSLPFVGEINAAGVDPGTLGKTIGQLLMEHMGLGRSPDVSVEVVQFRPFYIVGQVTTPGEFPYRPGLTVLQAVGIAGGLKTRDDTATRLEREAIAGRGDIGLLTLAGTNLLARKARLNAELSNADEVSFPDQLTQRASDSTVKLAMEQERMVFQARRDAMNTQIQALRDLKDFLVKEQASLESQLQLYDTQIELVQKELSGVSALVDKGFSAAARQITMERSLAQVRSDRLTAETAVFRARQEISRTNIAILDVGNNRRTEVTAALRETQTQLNDISRKADTTMQLLHETEVTAPRLLAMRNRNDEVVPEFVVVRRAADGTTSEIKATDTMAVNPGDIVKVKIPLPQLDDGLFSSNDDTTSAVPDASAMSSETLLPATTPSDTATSLTEAGPAATLPTTQ